MARAEEAAAAAAGVAEGWTLAGWLAAQHTLLPLLAHALLDGARDGQSELEHLLSLSDEELRERICGRSALPCLPCLPWHAQLAEEVAQARQHLKANSSPASELHSKFETEPANFTASFGNLNEFYKGLEGLIGPPSPNLESELEIEHTQRADSRVIFTANNYGTTTSAEIEWYFVCEPTDEKRKLLAQHYPSQPNLISTWPLERDESVDRDGPRARRQPRHISEFESQRQDLNKRLEEKNEPGLMKVELLAGRLYTGPMFMKYNAALRGLAELRRTSGSPFIRNNFVRLCCGIDAWESYQDTNSRSALTFDAACKDANKYTTSLHVINSAIIKLSKLVKATTVYRGLSGAKLPPSFMRESEDTGVRGGVEASFMSTSKSREAVTAYASNGGARIVLEIKMGMVDRGADVKWFSQYPHEEEILFAPLTGLQVVSDRVEKRALVLDIRLNINLVALTIEQVVSKMKSSTLQLFELLKEDLRESQDSLEELENIKAETAKKEAAWFNTADNYRMAVNGALDVKGRLQFEHELSLLKEEQHSTLQYGNLSEMYGGLRKAFGDPEPDTMAAMKREHVSSGDSRVTMEVSMPETDGKITSTPEIEWHFVVEPQMSRKRMSLLKLGGQPLSQWPVESVVRTRVAPRRATPIEDLRGNWDKVNAKLKAIGVSELSKVELIGLRLFTGTMGKEKYNPAIRFKASPTGAIHSDWARKLAADRRGNDYRTTIHTINGGIVRLSKIARAVPLWRGTTGALPPDSFHCAGEMSRLAGGTSYSFAPFSTDKKTAITYANANGMGVVLAAQPGVMCGAELGWLSQYPMIQEVTTPAFTFFRVVGKRVETMDSSIEKMCFLDVQFVFDIQSSSQLL